MIPKNGTTVQYIGTAASGQGPADPVMAKVNYNLQPLSNEPGPCDLLVEGYNGVKAVFRVPFSTNINTPNTWAFITGPLASAVATEESEFATAAAAVVTDLNKLTWAAEQTAVGTTGNGLRGLLNQTLRTS